MFKFECFLLLLCIAHYAILGLLFSYDFLDFPYNLLAVCALGILGNVVVLLALICCRFGRTNRSRLPNSELSYVCAKTLADILYLGAVINELRTTGYRACVLNITLEQFAIYVDSVCILSLLVMRFCAKMMPDDNLRLQQWQLLAVWILPVVLLSPGFVMEPVPGIKDAIMLICRCFRPEQCKYRDTLYRDFVKFFDMMLNWFAPALLFFLTNILIAIKVHFSTTIKFLTDSDSSALAFFFPFSFVWLMFLAKTFAYIFKGFSYANMLSDGIEKCYFGANLSMFIISYFFARASNRSSCSSN